MRKSKRNPVSAHSAGESRTFTAQGIRITLDRHGQPAIWEVLSDSSGLKVFYVAASVETRAKAEFGPPLPERQFSVERSAAESPRVVVARILDDAGVPMGPIVYLGADTARDVHTVLCRCMASQARELRGTGNYSLYPLAVAKSVLGPEKWARALGAPSTGVLGGANWAAEEEFWPGSPAISAVGTGTRLAGQSAIERALRLPGDF